MASTVVTEPPATTEPEPRLTFPRSIRALRDSKEAVEHGRTLIICLDGTGDSFDQDNSNIVHFVSCLKKHSLGEQITYYQSGIGTYDKGGLSNGIAAGLDMAVGSGLGAHIKDAYQFLMEHYQEGDKICLLGFSRGSYTVRCLAGFVHKCGLLPPSNISQINFAYKFYKDNSDEGWEMSREFKRTFCTDVTVHFVGLFDCVASVGFIPRKLPFSKSPTKHVRYFRHAMALDERRAKFKVCQWQHDNPDEPANIKRRATVDMTPGARLKRSGLFNVFRSKGSGTAKQAAKHSNETSELEQKFDNITSHLNGTYASKEKELEAKFESQDETRSKQKFTTDAKEVWFMGAHADCGGGAVRNEVRHKLSQIPLRWMLRQCFECDTGILFDTIQLARQGLDVHTLWPRYQPRSERPRALPPSPALMQRYAAGTLLPLKSRSTFLNIDNDFIDDCPTAEELQTLVPAEHEEDYFDALARINDQLVDARGWYVLEIWPIKVRVLASSGDGWEKKVRMNLGRYRAVRENSPNLHWTVQHMMEQKGYQLKCRVDKSTNWVEAV